MACGILTYFFLPSRPDEAKFLTTDEKEWLQAELAREQQQKVQQRQFSALQALTSGRVWHLVAIYFGMLTGLYSLNFCAPQLVKSLSAGSSNIFIGFLVLIPSLVGLAAMILISRSSDRKLERRYHVAIPAITGGVGLVLLGAAHSTFLAVALLSFVAIGVYGFFGPFSDSSVVFGLCCSLAMEESLVLGSPDRIDLSASGN